MDEKNIYRRLRQSRKPRKDNSVNHGTVAPIQEEQNNEGSGKEADSDSDAKDIDKQREKEEKEALFALFNRPIRY